jgi:hypothetical protein
MEFVFWPEVFDSIEELRSDMRDNGYFLEDVTHFFEISIPKPLHYPNFILKFRNDCGSILIYSISPQGTKKPICKIQEGEF